MVAKSRKIVTYHPNQSLLANRKTGTLLTFPPPPERQRLMTLIIAIIEFTMYGGITLTIVTSLLVVKSRLSW